MISELKHLSINDTFWIQFKEHLISFGYKGLPDQTHFTIVFDENKSDINFHITKNGTDPLNKPQIKLLVINRQSLIDNALNLATSLFSKILKPIDVESLKAISEDEIGFVSFEKLRDSESFSIIEKKLIDSYTVISKVRQKNRVKVEGNLEKPIEDLATSEELQASLKHFIVSISEAVETQFETGIIIWDENTIQVIQIGGKWYELKLETDFFKLLSLIMKTEKARELIWKTKRALVLMKTANTYDDTKHLNRPIRLAVSENIMKRYKT